MCEDVTRREGLVEEAPMTTFARSPIAPVEHAEQPTAWANVSVWLVPDWPAERRFPAGRVHHRMTMFGILGCAITGTLGAVLTLSIAPGLPGLALAELVLALAAALLISRCGCALASGGSNHRMIPHGRARRQGRTSA